MKMMQLIQNLDNAILLGLICSKITICFFNRVSQDTTVTM